MYLGPTLWFLVLHRIKSTPRILGTPMVLSLHRALDPHRHFFQYVLYFNVSSNHIIMQLKNSLVEKLMKTLCKKAEILRH